MARDKKAFVAPADGKAPRFSTGQKVFMVIGVIVLALGIASNVISLGVH